MKKLVSIIILVAVVAGCARAPTKEEAYAICIDETLSIILETRPDLDPLGETADAVFGGCVALAEMFQRGAEWHTVDGEWVLVVP